jgi:hypothetical protein
MEEPERNINIGQKKPGEQTKRQQSSKDKQRIKSSRLSHTKAQTTDQRQQVGKR